MTTAGPVPGGGRLGAVPVIVSLLLHGLLIAAAIVVRPDPPPPMPPVYRVRMEAAPAGPRRLGVVRDPAPAAAPAPSEAPRPTPPAARREVVSEVPSRTPAKTPPRATPNTTPSRATPTPGPAGATKASPASSLPAAGGGPVGGKGADVTTVDLKGIDFPFPGYLTNIVNQIGARFTRPQGRPLSAEVTFLIRRDGSVAGIRISRSSGVYAFDLEARGAVEAAAAANVFGPLPAGFADDVLPVIFRFDPKLLR